MSRNNIFQYDAIEYKQFNCDCQCHNNIVTREGCYLIPYVKTDRRLGFDPAIVKLKEEDERVGQRDRDSV